ncbi:hypothetical protein, partial [Pseudodesulfovibrio pelocollis]|uniref:hypothetical protein n=1 Tax=Pseudodesulfovibrio pelocollis TaxID=3051432 RepID=UPI00255ACB29
IEPKLRCDHSSKSSAEGKVRTQKGDEQRSPFILDDPCVVLGGAVALHFCRTARCNSLDASKKPPS